MQHICDVEVKRLKTHPDQRGFFREVIRATDPLFQDGIFGQWSHSKMQRNVVKAWHYHHVQTDWWYVPVGVVRVVLFDGREECETYQTTNEFIVGDSSVDSNADDVCIRIPPGVLHGLKVLSEEAHLFYITSHTYNPEEEGRYPYDSEVVGYNWGEDVIVSDNDRRTFVPTAQRVASTVLIPNKIQGNMYSKV